MCQNLLFKSAIIQENDQMHIVDFVTGVNPLSLFVFMHIHEKILLLYCRRILSEVNIKGGWVRAGGRGGPLDLDGLS